jgi:hypothetical protein
MAGTTFPCAKFLETIGIKKKDGSLERQKVTWYETYKILLLAHILLLKMEKLISYALEQKNVLMGNNVEVVRKGARELESEPKQCFGFSSGWF